MKQIIYSVENPSMSSGKYLLANEYFELEPLMTIKLSKKPTNWTSNLKVSSYFIEKKEPKILNKKSSKEEKQNG